MSERNKEYIAQNLHAFIANFGEVKIVRNSYNGYDIYYPADSDSYVFHGEDIKTIDGWLYGAVQAYHRIIPAAKKNGSLLR